LTGVYGIQPGVNLETKFPVPSLHPLCVSGLCVCASMVVATAHDRYVVSPSYGSSNIDIEHLTSSNVYHRVLTLIYFILQQKAPLCSTVREMYIVLTLTCYWINKRAKLFDIENSDFTNTLQKQVVKLVRSLLVAVLLPQNECVFVYCVV
jgi:hypothetical protein